ncbi:MAG: four helix bundle protein [Deltaproteobacteria bacterium]|nr:four helix bundle protein [Deltaproteobacteria bacterium]
MEAKNVYDKARGVVRELQPLLHTIREEDKSLAEQLKRAAQSVVLNIAEALTARKPPGHRADFIERGVHRLDLRAREVPVRHAELKSRAHLPARTSLAEPHADANRALAVPASFPSASAMLRTTLFIARWIWSKSDRSRLRTTGRICRSPPAAVSAFC